MNSLNLTKKALLISQIAVLFTALLADPAASQNLGSLYPSQSSRFFEHGNQQFEQETQLLKKDVEPVKIKLPQDLQQSQDWEKLHYWHQQQNLQHELNSTSDNEELSL